MDFKIGDCVRFGDFNVNRSEEVAWDLIGAEDVVSGHDTMGRLFLAERANPGSVTGAWSPSRFELVKAPETFIIVREDNEGDLLVWTEGESDLESATKHAATCAKTYGHKFTVFKAVASAAMPEVEPVVTTY